MSIIFHDSNIRRVSLPSTARLKMHKIKEEESKKYQRILHIASSKKMLGIQKFFGEFYEPELQLDLSAMNICLLYVSLMRVGHEGMCLCTPGCLHQDPRGKTALLQ